MPIRRAGGVGEESLPGGLRVVETGWRQQHTWSDLRLLYASLSVFLKFYDLRVRADSLDRYDSMGMGLSLFSTEVGVVLKSSKIYIFSGDFLHDVREELWWVNKCRAVNEMYKLHSTVLFLFACALFVLWCEREFKKEKIQRIFATIWSAKINIEIFFRFMRVAFKAIQFK